MKIHIYLATLILLGATACGDTADKQELIEKLRVLGAQTNPLTSTPSVSGGQAATVELTVYAAVTSGNDVVVESFEDDPNFSSYVLSKDEITIDTDSITYESYAGFRLASIPAQLTVPEKTALDAAGDTTQVRYGIVIRDGDEEEKVVGSFHVFEEGSENLQWSHPEISILTPESTDSLNKNSDTSLKSSATDNTGDSLTYGWFVSGGEIKNRRAKNTTWETGDGSIQTLVLTVRNKSSRGFAIEVRDFNLP